ncbi:MAG TPA: hypothetical protein VGO52_11790 [Hyphomonadaceae bacterium]|jgi:hypothetical protein|nr:hypothetical protein [Hyphomonadaceae bacterium]
MTGWKFLAALAAACAAGCQAAPDPAEMAMTQNIEFIRGCWISRQEDGGQIQATTARFLPSRDGRGALHGEILNYPSDPQTQPAAATILEISPDGQSLFHNGGTSKAARPGPETLVAGPMTSAGPPPGRVQAAWGSKLAPAMFVAEGGGDHLKLFWVLGDTHAIVVDFEGQRDGCD